MGSQVTEQTLFEKLDQVASSFTKTEKAQPIDAMDLVNNVLGSTKEDEHTSYLEKRVQELGMQNERQKEEIYSQAKQINKLEDAVLVFVEAIQNLRANAAEKEKEMTKLQEEVKNLRNDFDTWKQTERHSVADCLPILARYPATQNKEVNNVKNFLFTLYEHMTPEEREQLSALGRKETESSVQFNAPAYEVKDNERVIIHK